jgi:hypothetical protein
MNEQSAMRDEGSPFFIYTVTEESLEFFSRDVFLRSFLYVLRLKESSKPSQRQLLPSSLPSSHSLSTLLRLCKISREEEIKVRLDTKNENVP